jgi:hypothetical protein
MGLDDIVAILFVVAILLLIAWTVWITGHLTRRPTAIRISFSPHGARRFSWRRLWRRFVDTNIQPGETKPGVLVVLDQNGQDIPGAAFDAQPVLASSDESVFTVAPGSTFNDLDVTGVGAGSAILTADGSVGGNALQTGTATVTVTFVQNAVAIDVRFNG